jgi:hypothetical protein
MPGTSKRTKLIALRVPLDVLAMLPSANGDRSAAIVQAIRQQYLWADVPKATAAAGPRRAAGGARSVRRSIDA